MEKLVCLRCGKELDDEKFPILECECGYLQPLSWEQVVIECGFENRV